MNSHGADGVTEKVTESKVEKKKKEIRKGRKKQTEIFKTRPGVLLNEE